MANADNGLLLPLCPRGTILSPDQVKEWIGCNEETPADIVTEMIAPHLRPDEEDYYRELEEEEA